MLVLHYTGMETGEAALARLRDPAAKVSAHYVVEEDGRVFRLVPESRRAWHAGLSFWRGHRDVNSRSIGIELVNPGHEFGYRDFPPAQMAALIQLIRDITARHPIPPRNIVGHSDVAPTRKADPGERFDWLLLARNGIGLWPFDVPASASSVHPHRTATHSTCVGAAQRLLAAYGYDVPQTDVLDDATRCVLIAFQRHFRPACIDGNLDTETFARLTALAMSVSCD
ncbi:MAG TPA: N-acetylmuramoyl-L-alanine amidase [Alphaproteobacteria bacterium]